jgi:hypothetical protein
MTIRHCTDARVKLQDMSRSARRSSPGPIQPPALLVGTTQIRMRYIISFARKKLKGDLVFKIHNLEFLHHVISYVAYACVLSMWRIRALLTYSQRCFFTDVNNLNSCIILPVLL